MAFNPNQSNTGGGDGNGPGNTGGNTSGHVPPLPIPSSLYHPYFGKVAEFIEESQRQMTEFMHSKQAQFQVERIDFDVQMKLMSSKHQKDIATLESKFLS